jgi:hypothetical protein
MTAGLLAALTDGDASMLRNIRLTTLDMMRRPAFVSSVLRMLRDAFGLQPTEN